MTCKEICECIYDCFLDFFENIEYLTAFILQVLKWLFLVVTSPVWLIPYTIIKKGERKKDEHRFDILTDCLHPMCRCSFEPVFESEGEKTNEQNN